MSHTGDTVGPSAPDAWRRLDTFPRERLLAARVELHWASQLTGNFGHSFVEARPDWSHTALSWREDAFSSEATDEGLHVRLVPTSLRAELRRGNGSIAGAWSLAGLGLEEAEGELAACIARERGRRARALARGPWELPDHELGRGARFAVPDAPALDQLSRWFANAWELLAPLTRLPGSQPRRIWPHHFDLALLHLLDGEDADPESSPSVNVGFSPGDEEIPDPYFYVRPWPEPDRHGLPDLPAGSWRSEGWLAALLGADELLAAGAEHARAAAAAAFLRGAFRACIAALGDLRRS